MSAQTPAATIVAARPSTSGGSAGSLGSAAPALRRVRRLRWWRRWRRLLLSVAVVAAYVLTFGWLFDAFGPGTSALTLVPVITIAGLWGLVPGVVAALAAFPALTLLLNLAGELGPNTIFRHGGGPGTISMVLLAGLVGWLHDLLLQVRLQSARLRALHEATLLLARPIDDETETLPALLARVVEQAVAALDGSDGRLVLADDRAWDHLVRKRGPEAGVVRLGHTGRLHRSHLRTDGATAHVLLTGLPVLVPDTRKPGPFGTYPGLADRGVGSFAIVPLRAGGRVLGTLSVNFARRRALGTAEREGLELFAAHAAAALEREQLAHAERRLARQEAETAALREVDRLKNEFLRTITHELRTPLTMIHGYAELLQLQAGRLDTSLQERLGREIFAGSSQLTRLLDDLSDFGRIERGEVEVLPEPFDAGALLRDLVARLAELPGGDRLRLQAPDGLIAEADPHRVAQVVVNLVENALKYAPSGTIVVQAERVGAPPTGPLVRVTVRDRGPGIPYDEQPRVWEKFYRGSAVAGLNVVAGSGIGLAVVKALVEAQGGRVGLRSAPDAGASFWFELPAAVDSRQVTVDRSASPVPRAVLAERPLAVP